MRNVLIIFIALAVILVGGYFLLNPTESPEQANQNQNGNVAGETTNYPQAVESSREKLSAELNIPLSDVRVISYTEKEWPDACLGVTETGELCAQVVTPGYEVHLTTSAGGEYIFHTNIDGSVIRAPFIKG